MNILITGGAGYIGIELAYKLAILRDVTNITIYDNLARAHHNVLAGLRKFTGAKIKFVEGDILDTERLRKVAAECDVVFHMAAQVEGGHVIPAHLFEQCNNYGVASVTEVVRKSQHPIHLVHLSSSRVDSTRSDQQTFYLQSKARGERHLKLLDCSHHTVTLVRSPMIYGYSKNLRIDCDLNRYIFDANFSGRVKVIGQSLSSPYYCTVKCLVDVLCESIENKKNGFVVSHCPHDHITQDTFFSALTNIIPNLEYLFVDQAVYSNRTHENPGRWEQEAVRECSIKEIELNITDFMDSFTF